MKDETYYFHQTPELLCKELIKQVPLVEGDKVLEPFKGEGSFYNNLPDFVEKDWCEIEEGRNYKDYDKEFDWCISNPPFRLQEGIKRENAFWALLKYYTCISSKGVAFLGNDYCFALWSKKSFNLGEEAHDFMTQILKIIYENSYHKLFIINRLPN